MNISSENMEETLKNYQNDDIKESLKEISVDVEWNIRDVENGKFIEATIYINGNAYIGKVWARRVTEIRQLGLFAISACFTEWREENVS